MKILNVVTSVSPECGGPSEWIVQFCASVERLGHTAHILTSDKPDEAFVADSPLPVFALGSPLGPCRMYGWIKRNIHQYDMVMVHGLWRYSTVFVSRFAAKKGIPYFIYPHGALSSCSDRSLKTRLKRLYWRWIESRTIRRATGVVYTSEHELSFSVGAFSPYEANSIVLPLGVAAPDVDASYCAGLDQVNTIRLDEDYILFLGRVHPIKGCDLLLEAFSRIAPAYKDLKVVFAGPIDEACRRQLMTIIDRHGLDERVHWLGPVYGVEKWCLIAHASLFAMPSHHENFGIAIVESLGCGRPVVTTNKVAISDVILEFGAGFVSEDTVDGIHASLTRWIELPDEERNAMRDNAARCFRDRFSIDNAVRSAMDAFSKHAERFL